MFLDLKINNVRSDNTFRATMVRFVRGDVCLSSSMSTGSQESPRLQPTNYCGGEQSGALILFRSKALEGGSGHLQLGFLRTPHNPSINKGSK